MKIGTWRAGGGVSVAEAIGLEIYEQVRGKQIDAAIERARVTGELDLDEARRAMRDVRAFVKLGIG